MLGVNKTADPETQSIQVYVRIRPPLGNESPISCLESPTSKDVVVKLNYPKKFSFDEVFTSKSTQSNIYISAVKPYVSDIISGYNCTVITYGTTVTGKTYTMNGVIPAIQDQIHTDLHEECGMIPRVVSDLFMQLEEMQISHSVGCTYYELHNEELHDLLSDASPQSQPSLLPQLRIYDDRSNKGAVRIDGLLEIIVRNKSEVFKLLKKVHQKRVKNEKSGCHNIFNMKIRTHQTSIDGEQYITIGKLCMVDLAGTDTINRLAVDRRGRDALLTFRRVITALSEKNSHVPYRESKLTRILQDSLGGKSKTSIIATIGPIASSSDDILGTLEYAQRARTICNKPEINKKILQIELINHYIDENDRLRKDLEAARSGDGVYIDKENFEKMMMERELQKQQRLLITDLKNSIEEGNLEGEELRKYVKNACSDVLTLFDDYHKLCKENAQHIELLWSQQLEFYNKSTSVLSNCIDKIDARNLNMCLDEPKQSLNSRSEESDVVMDLKEKWDTSMENFHGCSSIGHCEACEISAHFLVNFENFVDTSFLDNSSFKNVTQANIDGYSKICAIEDSFIDMKESLTQEIKSTYATVNEHVMNVKKETVDLKSDFDNMRKSMNLEMSDVNEELQKYASSSLKSLGVANEIISEVSDPTRNAVGTSLSTYIEDSEQFISNSSEACIDQQRALKKIFQIVHNNVLEEHVVVEDSLKEVIDFSQSSMMYNSSISQNADQLQSTITNTNAKFEEVKHAGDTPTRPHHKVPYNLKELTPKEKALHGFRQRSKLRDTADADASKDRTSAMSEAED